MIPLIASALATATPYLIRGAKAALPLITGTATGIAAGSIADAMTSSEPTPEAIAEVKSKVERYAATIQAKEGIPMEEAQKRAMDEIGSLLMEKARGDPSMLANIAAFTAGMIPGTMAGSRIAGRIGAKAAATANTAPGVAGRLGFSPAAGRNPTPPSGGGAPTPGGSPTRPAGHLSLDPAADAKTVQPLAVRTSPGGSPTRPAGYLPLDPADAKTVQPLAVRTSPHADVDGILTDAAAAAKPRRRARIKTAASKPLAPGELPPEVMAAATNPPANMIHPTKPAALTGPAPPSEDDIINYSRYLARMQKAKDLGLVSTDPAEGLDAAMARLAGLGAV